MIEELQKELENEQKRRREIGRTFKDKIGEFNDEKKTLDRIKKQSDQLEK